MFEWSKEKCHSPSSNIFSELVLLQSKTKIKRMRRQHLIGQVCRRRSYPTWMASGAGLLVLDSWSLSLDSLTVGHGQWLAVLCPWSRVLGPWCLALGPFSPFIVVKRWFSALPSHMIKRTTRMMHLVNKEPRRLYFCIKVSCGLVGLGKGSQG